jgi:hypothetical protein
LSWSHNPPILSRSKREEERKFYLSMATGELKRLVDRLADMQQW